MENTKRKKIAVLGGGPSAMTAVYYMLAANDWKRDALDITVYQMGWRLGGKCASGRNTEYHHRVEEHGIHFWFGSYHNSFRWIRDCYDRLNQEKISPNMEWKLEEVLKACPSYVGFTPFETPDGWDRWKIKPFAWNIPPDDADIKLPDPKEDFSNFIADWVIIALEHLISHVTWENNKLKDAEIAIGPIHLDATKVLDFLEKVKKKFDQIQEGGKYSLVEKLVQELVKDLANFLNLVGDLFEDFIDRHQIVRRIFVAVDLFVSILNGLFQDDIFHQGFEVINDIDFFNWLRRNGISELTLQNTLLRSYYDGAFAFAHGDKNTPNSEAGTTLMGIVFALLTNDTAMFWKFKGSMAEIIFTPFYLILKHYGVKFKFFHRVQELKLTPDRDEIGELIIHKQVDIKADQEYDPFVEVKGRLCWPSQPNFDQLVEGEVLQSLAKDGKNVNLESFWSEWKGGEYITLRKGEHFDEVVFGISLASIPYLCTELIEAQDSWRDMLYHMQTVATQSIQIWATRSATDIGWLFPEATIYTTFKEPLDTWCANPDLVDVETWPAGNIPEDVFFFTGSLPDPGQIPPSNFHHYPFIMREKVQKQFVQYLNQSAPIAFPRVQPSEDSDDWFNWSLLNTVHNHAGMNRLIDQFFRANIDPSERYVLSVVNSSKFRLGAGESGFKNLFLTGDWIRTPLNSGCYEAATMAGLETARVVTGKPITIIGEFAFKTHPS